MTDKAIHSPELLLGPTIPAAYIDHISQDLLHLILNLLNLLRSTLLLYWPLKQQPMSHQPLSH